MLDCTLSGLLNEIKNDNIVLPAMQRPFVWKEERIYRLVDSLLRGFPIGAVMLWNTSSIQRFRRIQRDIDTKITQVYSFESSESNRSKHLVLDGQQRLTSLYAAFYGTYNQRSLYIDVLSGATEEKDPGNEYYACKFLSSTEVEKMNCGIESKKRLFTKLSDLISINPVYAAIDGQKKAIELSLTNEETKRIIDIYIRSASILGSTKSLQVIPVDEDSSHKTPIEEILEIFVRVNSGGLILLKSDLLMSLLDLKWNDIQPELQSAVKEINGNRPFEFTRDDILKSLLLSEGAETRFDKLVSNRNQVEDLAEKLPQYIPNIIKAWKALGCILIDDCKITSERFFRGGHNSLLPFVHYISNLNNLTNEDKSKIVVGIYFSIMSGIFSGAEARMGSFSKKIISNAKKFPLNELANLIKREYGIRSLDDLLRKHLDLALNIAHGGITLDGNPEDLQRDHIFSKSKLEKENRPYEMINHYANFHFLRGVDNLNKTDKPPHEWFAKPGKDIPPYSENDLATRLLTWEDLQPNKFDQMIINRGKKIRKKAEDLFRMSETDLDLLFG